MPKQDSVNFQDTDSPLKKESTLHRKLRNLQQEHPYLTQERGLTKETIIHFGLGYSTDECDMMAGHIIIPIHNIEGKLVAYAGHLPGESHDKDTPQYKYSTGFKTTQEVFNLHHALNEVSPKPLAIVNDFFDVVKLHQNDYRKVAALMGGTMSSDQEKLIRQNVNLHTRILILLNEDEAKRDKIAARLCKFCYVKVYKFGGENVQPKDLTAKQIEDLF